MTPLRYRIPDIIREHRKQQGYGQEQLSIRAGLGEQTCGMIERRETGGNFETYEKLLEALGLELEVRERGRG